MASDVCSQAFLQSQALNFDGVRTLRLAFCDMSGIRRVRAVRIPSDGSARSAFLSELSENGIGIVKVAAVALPSYGDVVLADSGLDATGEVRLRPDWSTYRRLPWLKSHAMVQVFMRHNDGSPWEGCPRGALLRALTALEKHGLRLQCGFESEFMLMRVDETGRRVPVDEAVYCQETAFENMAGVLDEMTSALEEMGISIVQFHPESAPGQFEIVTRHYNAMEAVDRLQETRAAISGVAAKHSLKASFLPKIMNNQAGSGAHCHFSLVDIGSGKNLFEATTNLSLSSKPQFAPQVENFIAGVLRSLPGLVLFTVPSPNSFTRLAPHCWAGCFSCWGIDNREAPLRLTLMPGQSGSLATTNVEYKLFDGTAEPHIGVAALIAGGIYGLENSLQLPNPIQSDPANVAPQQAAEDGVERLPTSISEAIEALPRVETFPSIRLIIGQPIIQVIKAVRLAEEGAFAGKSFEATVDVLCNRY